METLERLSSLTDRQLLHSKSIDFVRWCSAMYTAETKAVTRIAEVFTDRWPRAIHRDLITKAVDNLYTKAAVAVGTTTDATWASPLAVVQPLAQAFLEFSRPMTIIGRIPGIRTVPFNVSVTSQTGGGAYQWVGQNKPKPVTKADYATVTLDVAKAQGIIVLSEELLRLAVPGSEPALRAEMAAGIAQYLDQQFTDPAVAAVANVNPASITNTITPIVASGATSAALLTDIKNLTTTFFTNNPSAAEAVLIMQPGIAHALAIAANIATLGPKGGTYYGTPVVTSGSVGARIIMLDASAILVADGGLEVDLSRDGLVQMESVPTEPTDATTVYLSVWQRSLVGVKSERFVNWKRARTSAVQFISSVAYV